MTSNLTVEELQFYEKQIILPEFGVKGQEALNRARVLVVGAGGLGCPILQYLVSLGVGTIGILDGDIVEIGNLCRQPLYTLDDIGKKKAHVAKSKLSVNNPFIQIEAIYDFLSEKNFKEIFIKYDVIVGATDNIFSYYLIDEACARLNKPFVYGAISQSIGHVAVLNFPRKKKYLKRYQDLFPIPPNPAHLTSCQNAGVLGYTPAVIAVMQVIKVIQLLTKHQNLSPGILWVFDSNTIQMKRYCIPTSSTSKFSVINPPVQISQLEVEMLFASHKNTILVDVRLHVERNLGHLGGYHVPPGKVNKFLKKCSAGDCIVFYCQKGIRSSLAALKARQDFKYLSIFSLSGGYIENKAVNLTSRKKAYFVKY